MARTEKQSFASYLAKLPEARRASFARVRELVKKNLPPGYVETVRQKMILYEVPLKVYPDTYNKEPLCYAALASQKNYMSLYVMAAYGDSVQARRLQEGFRAAGKKLDMGKSCIRFQNANDLALDAIAEVVASTPMDKYVAFAKSVHSKR